MNAIEYAIARECKHMEGELRARHLSREELRYLETLLRCVERYQREGK